MKYLYNYPSTLSTEVLLNPKIVDAFKKEAIHYTCVSGYNFANGSFRGSQYKYILQTITGLDISQLLEPKDIAIIYCKLHTFTQKVQESEVTNNYKKRYPYYSNYPIQLSEYFDNIDAIDSKYVLSIYELLFLEILFKIYYENAIYLIPIEQ